MSENEPPEGGNAAQIAYWNDRAGATWVAQQERLDQLFQPITDIAIEAAAATAGETVIDVGCGCGATLLALAERVGPTGRVTGLDVSVPMSTRAQARIAGLPQAAVKLGDAASMALPDAAANLVFSRFGVMFFDEPTNAFAHLRQAMRPDGRLLFVVWRTLADNPWFSVPLKAALDLLPPQPSSDPTAPGPFALADEDRTRDLLTRAGWRDVSLTRHDVGMRIAGARDLAAAADFAVTVGPVSRMLAEMPPESRTPVRDAVAQAIQDYDTPDGFILNGSVWTVAARV
jgi:SAM-dependent methyltransferase